MGHVIPSRQNLEGAVEGLYTDSLAFVSTVLQESTCDWALATPTIYK